MKREQLSEGQREKGGGERERRWQSELCTLYTNVNVEL